MQTVSSLTEGRTKVISSNSLFTVPLFSLRSPSSARDKKKKNRRRYIDRQRKGVRVGKKNIGSSLFFFSHAPHLFLRAHRCFWKERTGHSSKPHCHTKPFTAEFVAVWEALKQLWHCSLYLRSLYLYVMVNYFARRAFCKISFSAIN